MQNGARDAKSLVLFSALPGMFAGKSEESVLVTALQVLSLPGLCPPSALGSVVGLVRDRNAALMRSDQGGPGKPPPRALTP